MHLIPSEDLFFFASNIWIKSLELLWVKMLILYNFKFYFRFVRRERGSEWEREYNVYNRYSFLSLEIMRRIARSNEQRKMWAVTFTPPKAHSHHILAWQRLIISSLKLLQRDLWHERRIFRYYLFVLLRTEFHKQFQIEIIIYFGCCSTFIHWSLFSLFFLFCFSFLVIAVAVDAVTKQQLRLLTTSAMNMI